MELRTRNWLRIALRCALAAALVLNLAVLVLRSQDGEPALRSAPLALLQVIGGSMEPKYHAGDAILTRPVPFEELRTGDVIVFSRDDELIVHQVIAKGSGSVVTQGTANEQPDDPVSREEYRARVVARIPLLGAVMSVYTSVPRLLIFATLLTLLVFGDRIFPAVFRRLTKEEKNKA